MNSPGPTEISSEIVNSYDFVHYDAKWQEPVITEKCIYDLFKGSENVPYNYFAFPWATYIDNKWKNDKSLNTLLDDYIPDPTKTYFTVCQHWRFREYMNTFKRIRIEYLFTPHCSIGDEKYELSDGIKVLPLSLFPAQRSPREKITNIQTRPLIASFIGQYNPKIYMTDVRIRLFDGFAEHKDCLVLQRNEWHYQGAVYRGDANGSKDAEEQYIQTLCDSKFSLCPSGCGPNTIRIWESMQCGAIPVILADTLIMPPCNRPWKDCCVFWKESDIGGLYEHLKSISDAQLTSMSVAAMKLYDDYFSDTTMNRSILDYFGSNYITNANNNIKNIMKTSEEKIAVPVIMQSQDESTNLEITQETPVVFAIEGANGDLKEKGVEQSITMTLAGIKLYFADTPMSRSLMQFFASKQVVTESSAPAAEVAPVVEAPVVEAPVVEAPVVEAPVVEAPVVEAAPVVHNTAITNDPSTPVVDEVIALPIEKQEAEPQDKQAKEENKRKVVFSFSMYRNGEKYTFGMLKEQKENIKVIKGDENSKGAVSSQRVVFSFSLFGTDDKYTVGMIKNCEIIQSRFPDARVFIYIANDVPTATIAALSKFKNVKMINVKRGNNLINIMDRLLAVDDSETDIVFIRDTDSRIHERDASCVEDFINSDKAFHIIRDHDKHSGRIMGGMIGIRKRLFSQNMANLIKTWADKKEKGADGKHGCDTHFILNNIYSLLKDSVLVHDPYQHFKDEVTSPIRCPISNNDYIGRVVNI